MQGAAEDGLSSEQIYLRYVNAETDTIPYLYQWLEVISDDIAPGTYVNIKGHIKHHLEPFFTRTGVQLGDIRYDTLMQLKSSIPLSEASKKNIIYTLRNCLTYAYKADRIKQIPPLPKFKTTQKPIKWVSEDRQMNIINAIPESKRPIFLFLKYHMRRPSEACALRWEDYDQINRAFVIRRSVSAGVVVAKTKTRSEHVIPCHPHFEPIIKGMQRSLNGYVFINPHARNDNKRFDRQSLLRIWQTACKKVGENITMYAGLKHSTCSQYINEKRYSLSELQVITDHKQMHSVKQYASVELERKRELLEGKVVPISFKRSKTNSGTN
jgi:integrase